MPGTYIKPRAFNRRIFINIGTPMVPQWAEIAVGISSRGVTFTENEEEYYYMSERGTAEKEPTTQSVSRSFTGNRFVGDAAQDAGVLPALPVAALLKEVREQAADIVGHTGPTLVAGDGHPLGRGPCVHSQPPPLVCRVSS